MKVEVKAKNGEFRFECNEGEHVLYAGLRQGVDLPYECATGTCGTCKARAVEESPSYNIDEGWAEAPGRSYLKSSRGEFLMCQAHVRDSCRIVVPSKLNGSALQPCPDYRDGTIRDVQQLNDEVIEFDVDLDAPMSFRAGQFACLQTPEVTGYRAYSMVNFEREAVGALRFVVKRKAGGAFCTALFDRKLDGAPVRVFGPLGKATFDPDEDRNLLCVAGGSGIAGMMAILRHGALADYFAAHDVHVFFGIRANRDAFYPRRTRASRGRQRRTPRCLDRPVRRGCRRCPAQPAPAAEFRHRVRSRDHGAADEGPLCRSRRLRGRPAADGRRRAASAHHRRTAAGIGYTL
ncbi:MAG: 2Fe-2S iron-sulfur cluster-binding protein [Gammaproteobacteria bacterium]|nr:2Fe-2S iron-sulfur cluster-binding protein [Gammaproteobacteria bacterium]